MNGELVSPETTGEFPGEALRARAAELGLDSGMPAETVLAVSAVLLVTGALYCFLGYRTLKLTIALLGFVLAGVVAHGLAGFITDNNETAMWIAGGLGGVAGALALLFVYKAGIFCLGLTAALLIAHNALGGQDLEWAPWATLIAAVAGGLVALIIERPVVTLATAAIGAWLITTAVIFYTVQGELGEYLENPGAIGHWRWAMLGAWLVLTIAGAQAQFATHRRGPRAPLAAGQ